MQIFDSSHTKMMNFDSLTNCRFVKRLLFYPTQKVEHCQLLQKCLKIQNV